MEDNKTIESVENTQSVESTEATDQVKEQPVEMSVKEMKRALSKEMGINLFELDKEKYNEFSNFNKEAQPVIEEKDTLINSLNERLKVIETERSALFMKNTVLELNIKEDSVDKVKVLADYEMSKNPDLDQKSAMQKVITDMPYFTNEVVETKPTKIGLPVKDTFKPAQTDADAYMAKNYANSRYYKKR